MAVAAQSVGIAGLVTDGSVRDSDQMFNLGFPVFCSGVCIKGTSKERLGLREVGTATSPPRAVIFFGKLQSGIYHVKGGIDMYLRHRHQFVSTEKLSQVDQHR